jgi:hypothetical protein
VSPFLTASLPLGNLLDDDRKLEVSKSMKLMPEMKLD